MTKFSGDVPTLSTVCGERFDLTLSKINLCVLCASARDSLCERLSLVLRALSETRCVSLGRRGEPRRGEVSRKDAKTQRGNEAGTKDV